MTRALYPGTFDPIHNGHIDIATRASLLFDELVLAVYDAPPKKLLFDTEERVAFAQAALAHLPNVTVMPYVGLTVNCAVELEAQAIVRGLRNVADFEYEHQIGWANKQLAPHVDVCCLFCNGQYAYLSATILKEVAGLGGDIRAWAPPVVQAALAQKFPRDDTDTAAADGATGPAVGPTVESFTRSHSKLSHRG
ncbi:MAG: pantetheine-phosphate adenylyltransferase [Litorilinea sp.]